MIDAWRNPCSQTYNSQVDGHTTKGGYSDHVVVREEFMLHVPDNLSMAGTAPLLCAGITGAQPPLFFPLRPSPSDELLPLLCALQIFFADALTCR